MPCRMSKTQIRKPRSVKGFGKIIQWEDTGQNLWVTLDIYTYPSVNTNHDACSPYQVSPNRRSDLSVGSGVQL